MMDANAIFDAVLQAGAEVMAEEAIRSKCRELTEAKEKRCGNCDRWMKSSCTPEKEHGQFKSMRSFPCRDFERCLFSTRLIQQRTIELHDLETSEKGTK